MFLGKGVLEIYSKFTEEPLCQSVISIKVIKQLYIEIKLWRGCSPVNLLHNFRTLFPKNTSRGLALPSHSDRLIAASAKLQSFGPR